MLQFSVSPRRSFATNDVPWLPRRAGCHRYASFVINSAAGTTNRHYPKNYVIVVTTSVILVTFISRVEKAWDFDFDFSTILFASVLFVFPASSLIEISPGSDVAGPGRRRFFVVFSSPRGEYSYEDASQRISFTRERREQEEEEEKEAREDCSSRVFSHPRRSSC